MDKLIKLTDRVSVEEIHRCFQDSREHRVVECSVTARQCVEKVYRT